MIDFTQLNNTFFYVTDKQDVINIINVVSTVCLLYTSPSPRD